MREGSLPYARMHNPTGKKTCWDCVHVRVGNFPNRWCSKLPKTHIWCSPESEVQETGTTVASTCHVFENRFHPPHAKE